MESDNGNSSNSVLEFQLLDDDNNIYKIKMEFGEGLFITATNLTCFPKKVYIGSFYLYDLKKRYKFFRIYDSIFEAYNDLNSLRKQNDFVITNFNNIISLCIKKQIGFQNDIIFPLKEEEANIDDIVFELCDKYLNLEKRVEFLEKIKYNIKQPSRFNGNTSKYYGTNVMNGYGFANKK